MCKKFTTIILTLMTSVFAFSACGGNFLSDSDMDIYEKIHAYYGNMNCYSANVSFSCYSNKTENTYVAEQKAKDSDKFHLKVTLPDSDMSVTTITNGQSTKTLTDGTGYSVTVPSAETSNLLFINNFFKTYYSSEDTYLAVGNTAKGNETLLETAVFPQKTTAAKMSLSVNNKTLAPLCLTVYDMGGNVTMRATFSEFSYNDKAITDDIFSTN